MKKLINDVQALVPEMLEGLAMAHPGLSVLDGWTVALRSDADAVRAAGQVALISGGGAGHEPAHAGYVGTGMLTAAVVGDVFTSPSTDAVLAAIRAVGGPAGVLLIVKNYTGDRLNFGLAAEIARTEGIPVEMLVVADDVALAARGDHAGRRGIAGTVLVHKIAGAAAASGLALADVRAAAEAACSVLGSMGVALGACTVPAAGRPGFDLADDEIELGLGIHGEAGVARLPLEPVDALVARLFERIAADLALVAGDRVALLVNHLGGTPAIELAIATRAALLQAGKRGLVVERLWSGCFLTALEMPGVSLSVLRVDDARLALLDAPTGAPAWPSDAHGRVRTARQVHHAAPAPAAQASATHVAAQAAAHAQPVALLRAVGQALHAAEDELTRMDQQVGDGDLGISLARGARAIERDLPGYPLHDAAATLRALAATVRQAVGGTSGPLYAIALLRAATAFEQPDTPLASRIALALQAAAQGIAEVGGATAGDRTMLDALLPAAEAMQAAALRSLTAGAALAAAMAAAQQGADATADMHPRRGRSSYLGQRALGHKDPGAQAVVVWLQALLPHLP